VEVASDVSSTVVVSRNVAITSETYAEVNVIIWRADDVVDVVIVVEVAAGGGMQVVTTTSGKQVKRDEMQVMDTTWSWQGSRADDAVVIVTASYRISLW
jgi:hypothetical protein